MEHVNFTTDQLLELSPSELVTFFQEQIFGIEYKLLFDLLKCSPSPVVRVLVRMALKCKESAKPFGYSLGYAERRCLVISNVSRRKFVRRVYASAPLFALDLIRERYPDYTAVRLAADLVPSKKRKARREKFVRRPSEMGFRISMIRWLAAELRFKDLDPALYHRYCNRIAGYQNGLNLRLPVLITVVYSGESQEYGFPWNVTKFRIDSFVALTKRVSSFDKLDAEWASLNRYGR